MNASSSDACIGVSSWRTMPLAAAVSPTCADREPRISATAGSTDSTVTFGPDDQFGQPRGWGERTRTDFFDALRTNSLDPHVSRSIARARSRSVARLSATSRSSDARRRTPCGPQRPALAGGRGPIGFPRDRGRSPARRTSPSVGRRAAPRRCRAAGPCRARTRPRASVRPCEPDHVDQFPHPGARDPVGLGQREQMVMADRPVCTERASSSAPTSPTEPRARDTACR